MSSIPERLRTVVEQFQAMLAAGGGLIAYPTDSCYALGCHIGDKEALERLRRDVLPYAGRGVAGSVNGIGSGAPLKSSRKLSSMIGSPRSIMPCSSSAGRTSR